MYLYLLAHGQSQAECGFNINEAMLVENLEETSIKGQRLLYDYMASKNVLFTNLLFPKNLHYPASLHTVNIKSMESARVETVSESKNPY